MYFLDTRSSPDNIVHENVSFLAELEPLRATLKAREEEAEKTSAEMTAIKADNQRWKARVTQLIEKHQKISPEEMKKVQMENSKLQENLQVATSNNKNLAAKNNNLANQLKASQENLKQTTEEKTQEIKKLTQVTRNYFEHCTGCLAKLS